MKNSKKKLIREIGKKRRFNISLIVVFFVGTLLIFSTYAWFYATLDVKIDMLKMVVQKNTDITISLDGINYAHEIELSRDNLVLDLKNTYPNNNNQWASSGLLAVSSNGIPDANTSQFAMFSGYGVGKRFKTEEQYDSEDDKIYFTTRVFMETKRVTEEKPSTSSTYIAFDFFIKNVSGSPKSDNLYFNEGTEIYYNDISKGDFDGIINSLRIGIVKIGSVSLKSNVKDIQNLSCNNNCQMIMYEPNSFRHSPGSIKRATKYGVTLVDGEYCPTYAVINEGIDRELANGQENSEIPLDTEHFAIQNTIKDKEFENPIFEIPNAVSKFRAYIWIEGQDMDSLETSSDGGIISVIINFIKDNAGYY